MPFRSASNVEQPRTNNLQNMTKSRIDPAVAGAVLVISPYFIAYTIYTHFSISAIYCLSQVSEVIRRLRWLLCLPGTFQPSHRNLMPFLVCLHQQHDFTPSRRRPPVKAFRLEFFRYAVMYHRHPLRTEYRHRKGHRLPLVADYPVCLWFCVCSRQDVPHGH